MTMFHRSAYYLIAALLFFSMTCWAQEATDFSSAPSPDGKSVLKLSLKQAIDIALGPDGNIQIQIAEELINQAEARSAQSRAALLPNIDASIGQQNMTRNLAAFGIQVHLPIPGYTFPTFVGPFNVFDARATANLNIFNLSSIRRYQASRQGISQAESEQENIQDQIRNQVAQAYLFVLRAQVSEDAARASVKLADELLKLASDQKSAGAGTGIDVTRANVQLANEQQRFLLASHELNRAKLQLLRILGLDLNMKVELTEQLTYKPVELSEPHEVLQMALVSRADWKAQQKREEMARLNYSAAKFERVPSIYLFADYGIIGSSINHAIPTRAYGFSLQIPIFDGGRLEARRAESSSQLQQELVRSRDLRAQIEMEIRLAIDSLMSADFQVKTAEEGFKLSENELAQAQRRFKAGVGSSIEVTDAQTRLERARDNRIKALFNYNLARIDLYTAAGTIEQMIH